MTIKYDLETLKTDSLIELFEFDATAQGQGILRWHSGVNEQHQPIVWQGNTYSRFPIEANGFEYNGKGSLPRPTLRAANIGGVLGSYIQRFDDALGVKVTRTRTLAKYLDAINFENGNDLADPNAFLPPEIYFISRKTNQNPIFIEFELATPWDLQGLMLPRRQVIASICPWRYRQDGCGYTGAPVEDWLGNATTDPSKDGCQKTLRACKAHFGQYGDLPFGGFPASMLFSKG
jgi:lambda family phage minor tail protein L